MKKFFSVLLSLLLIISVFSGCKNLESNGNDTNKEDGESNINPENEETITAVIYDRGNDKEYWENVITSFEENNPGIKVDAIISHDAAYELRDRILSGNSPDFVYLPSDEESGVTTALIKDKAMLDLSDIEPTIKSLVLDGITDNNICRPNDDGKLYIAPLFFETEGLLVNMSLLNEKGWILPKSWDDFISLAEKTDKENIAVLSYAGQEPDEFVNIFAASVASEIGNEKLNSILNCNSDSWDDNSIKEFAEKLESIKKLVLSGSSNKDRESVIKDFKDGKVLFISGNNSTLKEVLSDTDLKIKVGFNSYPSLLKDGTTSIVNVSEMYIPVESKKVSSAKKFLIYQYSDEAAKIAAEKLGEAAPTINLQTIASENDFENQVSEIYKTIGTKVFVPQFKIKAAENETLKDEFCDLCVSVFRGDVESDDFQKQMKDIIKDY